ncbi:cyclin-Q-like [Ostrea edulis]|uniref:cyclin-Q-like n=1 Tax=Ostrea edulis TaxID=37623 RepID=UPI002094C333|nr:cyclin-Q-like [Ostrea edulis]
MTDTEAKVHFRVIRFIHEAGLRLHMTSVSLATASVIYHKFFRENSLQQYDPYLIATTALYLAGKAEEQHIKIRDIVNVCYRTLHRSKPPLEMGEAFWSLRNTVSNCELFVLRMLQFKISFQHPHKYLLHYLKFLKDWFEPYKWETTPIARSAWTFLKDSYHGTLCLRHKPQHIAVGLIYMALQCHGVEVPLQTNVAVPWWKVLTDDITEDMIKDIIEVTIWTYDLETMATS